MGRAACLRIWSPLLIVAVLMLSGCSDDASEERDYLQALRQVEQGITEDAKRFGTGGDAGGDAGTLLDDDVARMRELQPPERWRDEHAEAVSGLQLIDQSFDEVQAALDREDPEAIRRALGTQQEAVRRFEVALESVRRDARD